MINYFVALFWLIKIKFFQNESDWNDEAYLLRMMSIQYSKVMDIIGSKAKAEHEKIKYFDFFHIYYVMQFTIRFIIYALDLDIFILKV